MSYLKIMAADVLRKKLPVFGNKLPFLALIAVLVFATCVPAFAQTPVPIVIDTNEIFTQTNIWIDVFIPIMAIGIGIAVALAILTFIGNQILRAFKGGGR